MLTFYILTEMASASSLPKGLTCPIHKQLYEEPRLLACGHTICLTDLRDQGWDSIACLHCGKTCSSLEVRPDTYKLNQIIMYVHDDCSKAKRKHCDICKVKVAEKLCSDCQQFYCVNCEYGSDRKCPHDMVKISDIVISNKAKLGNAYTDMVDTSDSARTIEDTLSANLDNLDKAYQEGLQLIEENEKEIVDLVRTKFKQQLEKLEVCVTKRKETLQKDLREFDSKHKALWTQIREFETSIQETNENILVDDAHIAGLTESWRDTIDTCKEYQQNACVKEITFNVSLNQSDIHQSIGKALDEAIPLLSEKFPTVEADKAIAKGDPNIGNDDVKETVREVSEVVPESDRKLTLRDFTTRPIMFTPLTYINSNREKPKQSAMINGQIWIVLDNGTIHFIDQTGGDALYGEEFMNISITGGYQLIKVVQAPEQKVVGLIERNGKFLARGLIEICEVGGNSLITSKPYADVAADNRYVYAFQNRDIVHEVDVYEHKSFDWSIIKNVKINAYDPMDLQNIMANDQNIFLCSFCGKHFIRYDINTDNETPLWAIGKWMKLLACDNKGNLLFEYCNKLYVHILKSGRNKKLKCDIRDQVKFDVEGACIDGEGNVMLLLAGGKIFRLSL